MLGGTLSQCVCGGMVCKGMSMPQPTSSGIKSYYGNGGTRSGLLSQILLNFKLQFEFHTQRTVGISCTQNIIMIFLHTFYVADS